MADDFSINLLRMIAAELHVLNCSTAARDLFGRSYHSLSQTEKALAEKTVFDLVAGNFQALTADFLAAQKQSNPVGFGIPKDQPSNPSGAGGA